MPPKLRRRIDKRLKAERTSLFDTHPAFPVRMENVRNEQADGIFHLDLPASELFSDFGKLSGKVTGDLYRQVLSQIDF